MTRSSTLGRPAAIGVALALATLVSGASSTAAAGKPTDITAASMAPSRRADDDSLNDKYCGSMSS